MEPQDPTTEEPAPDPRLYHWGVGGIALAAGWHEGQPAIFMTRLAEPLPVGIIPEDHPARTVERDNFDLLFTFETMEQAEAFFHAMSAPKRPKAWNRSREILTEWRLLVKEAKAEKPDEEGGAA